MSSESHLPKNNLLDKLKLVRTRGGLLKEYKKCFSDFRSECATELDLTGLVFENMDFSAVSFDGFDLSKCVFENTNLTQASFHGCILNGAKFIFTEEAHEAFSMNRTKFVGAKLIKASFMDCDLTEAVFGSSVLREASFKGCIIHKASFSHANLEEADLRYTEANTETTFIDLMSSRNCKIHHYTLSCLSDVPGKSGLTIGNRMVMKIENDAATLRNKFGGVWAWVHGISLLVFAAPYLWFLGNQWVKAEFRKPSDDANTMTVIEAILRYIWTGGEDWQHSSELNYGPFFAFILILFYNTGRGLLLFKTKQLETKESVSGVPVLFSLEDHPCWRFWDKLTKWGVFVAFALVLYNTHHFLSMEITVD